MRNLSIILFGLDQNVLTQISNNVRNKFDFLSWQFLFQLFCICLSMGYFFFLLTSSIILGFILGTIVGAIFSSILRFTIITIGLPISAQTTSSFNIIKKGVNIIRLIIYGAYCFVLLVPFVSLFYHANFNASINKYKESIISNYSKNLDLRKENNFSDKEGSLKKLELEIQLMELEISKSEDKKNQFAYQLQKLKGRYSDFKKSFQVEKLNYEKESENNLSSFTSQIVSRDYPFKRFSYLFSTNLAVFFLIILSIIFLSLVWQYIKLVSDEKSQYYFLCSKLYSERIQKDYLNICTEQKEWLSKNFNYKWVPDENFLDPPFNENRKKSFVMIENTSLFDSWKTKKTS
jgi:hypothetical protein